MNTHTLDCRQCIRTVRADSVCVCLPVCAITEGARRLQRVRLFSLRDPEDGEDHLGQTELGPAHRHSAGLSAHCTSNHTRAQMLTHYYFLK